MSKISLSNIACVGVALAVAIAAGAATAADLRVKAPKAPPAPVAWVPNWTGLYLGAHGGCAWHAMPTPTNYAVDPGDVDGTGAPETTGFAAISTTSTACFGGGQLGYNHQLANNFVVGIEADASAVNFQSTWLWSQPFGSPSDNNNWEAKLTAFGTVRARLGYAYGPVLPYITGGWAWARGQLTATCPSDCDVFGAGPAVSSDTQIHSGWVLGGGLEVALNRNWSLKGEYLHLDLGSQRYNVQVDFDAGVPPGADFGRLVIDTVKVGLNYKLDWNGAVIARY